MKKIFYILISCIILFTSCAKNFDPNEESNLNPKTIEFSITANAPEYEAFETKGSLGAVTRVYWETNDQVAVYSVNGENSLTYLGILSATIVSTSKATATFTGTLTLPSTTPSKLTFVYPASANLLDNTGAVVSKEETESTGKGKSTGASISYDLSHQTISSNGRVEFCANANSDYSSETVSLSSLNFYLASSFMSVLVTDETLAGKTISNVDLSNINSEVVLTPTSEYILQPSTPTSSTSSIHVTYNTPVTITDAGKSMVSFAVPATAQPASRKIRINGQYSTSFSTKAYEYGQYYLYPVSSFNLGFGPFTLADGKTVYFAPANLYWDGSVFKFEANQTDYPSSWDANHVGHFFWTNSTDYKSGNSAYMPYAEIYKYANSKDDDKRTQDDTFWCGEGNKLTVDGADGWYALTGYRDGGYNEWEDLINRKDASGNNLYNYPVEVTNNGTSYNNCLIIAPDDYTETLKSSYTLVELNAAGLVCLPAAGSRNGFGPWIEDYGDIGGYWSASPAFDHVFDASYLLFSSDSFSPGDSGFRGTGYPLRLVRNVE